jgi:TatD DNase family protein
MINNNLEIGVGVKYIDIHSHLSFGDYQNDFGDVLKRMHEAGVGTITVGTDLKSSIEAVKIAEENENIWACIGVHPTAGGESCEGPSQIKSQFDGASFEKLVKNPKVVAIGECGLDYFRLEDEFNKGLSSGSEAGRGKSSVEFIQKEKARQQKEFIKQIEFAIKYDKPLMLHIRSSSAEALADKDAHDDAYDILKKYPKARGDLHFFTGNSELAKKFIDLGYTVSFPGVITFPPKADQPRADANDAIRNIPLDKIHAETDSPFAAPVPYRGKRNEPSYVIEVVKKIAEIRGENFDIVQKQLINNAKSTFGLKF